MRELIEGVTKIEWVSTKYTTHSLCEHKSGILYNKDRMEWRDANGDIFCWGVAEENVHDYPAVNSEWIFVDEDVVDNKESAMYIEESTKSEWTDKHYDHYYTLTPEDIAAGKIKVDPYFVNTIWGINDADKTGAAFHNLKTLSRMAKNKNSLAREWDAMIGQSTRARQLMKGE